MKNACSRGRLLSGVWGSRWCGIVLKLALPGAPFDRRRSFYLLLR